VEWNVLVLPLKRNALAPRQLLQVCSVVDAPTSGKRDRHHNGLELCELVHQRVDFLFLEVEPYFAQVGAFNVFYKHVLCPSLVLWRIGIRVDFRNGDPFGTKEVHCSNLTSVSVRLGDEDGIRNSCDQLEPVL